MSTSAPVPAVVASGIFLSLRYNVAANAAAARGISKNTRRGMGWDGVGCSIRTPVSSFYRVIMVKNLGYYSAVERGDPGNGSRWGYPCPRRVYPLDSVCGGA